MYYQTQRLGRCSRGTAPVSQPARVIGALVLALLWMALLVFAAVVGLE